MNVIVRLTRQSFEKLGLSIDIFVASTQALTQGVASGAAGLLVIVLLVVALVRRRRENSMFDATYTTVTDHKAVVF